MLARGKYEDAVEILKHMYALNTSRHAEGYTVSSTEIVVVRSRVKTYWSAVLFWPVFIPHDRSREAERVGMYGAQARVGVPVPLLGV